MCNHAQPSRFRAASRRLAWGLAPLLLILLVWQLTAFTVRGIRGVPFPTPLETGARVVAILGGADLSGHTVLRHTADSLVRWSTGFALAAIAGLAIGLLAGRSATADRLAMPIVHTLQLIPGLAWIPVAILVFGIGEAATIFMIAATALTPVAISVASGVKRVDATYVRAARMLGAKGARLFLRVLVPGSLPHVLSGLRIGLGNSWRVLVASEMIVGTGTGLGYSIIQARWTLDYQSAFACMFFICAIGLAIEKLVFARIEAATIRRWELGT